jgi:iron-sulfur cluster assembly protein
VSITEPPTVILRLLLTLTPEAVRSVIDVVDASDPSPGAGLRIAPRPPSAFEPTWAITVEPEPQPGDVVVEADQARVFVDPDAAAQLENAVLDAHVHANPDETHFVVQLS